MFTIFYTKVAHTTTVQFVCLTTVVLVTRYIFGGNSLVRLLRILQLESLGLRGLQFATILADILRARSQITFTIADGIATGEGCSSTRHGKGAGAGSAPPSAGR